MTAKVNTKLMQERIQEQLTYWLSVDSNTFESEEQLKQAINTDFFKTNNILNDIELDIYDESTKDIKIICIRDKAYYTVINHFHLKAIKY